MSVASVQYSKGHFLMLSRDCLGDPLFGRIINFVCLSDSGKWLVAVEHVKTAVFVAEFHAIFRYFSAFSRVVRLFYDSQWLLGYHFY